MMAMNLLKLFLLTDTLAYKELLDTVIDCFAVQLNSFKMHASYFMRVIRYIEEGTREIIVAIPDSRQRDEYCQWLRSNKEEAFVSRLVVDRERCIDGKPTVYRCHNGACKQPEII